MFRIKRFNFLLCLSVFIFVFLVIGKSLAVDAPGNILFEKKGKLWMIQPDHAGEKVISEKGASSNALFSSKGEKVFYPLKNKIYMVDMNSMEEKLVYDGEKEDRVDLYSSLTDLNSFIFRKLREDGCHEYFRMTPKDNKVESLKTLYENPFLSRTGKYWAWTTCKPGEGKDKSRIYAARVGNKKKQFVFQGVRKNIIGWDSNNPTVMYSMFDRIYAFDIVNRRRQRINLPFKDIFVIAYNKTGLLYYNLDQEEKDPGILLFDPQSGEQKQVIEKKKSAYLVTYNKNLSKVVFFCPTKFGDDMGHGELYLFESGTGEATKLTNDMGKRVILEKNMNLQWSPDGKYFVYEKLKIKFSQIKRSDIWIAGEGKNERLRKRACNPVWGVIK